MQEAVIRNNEQGTAVLDKVVVRRIAQKLGIKIKFH
jgi:ribosome-binding protein aMBF1 (putative translation factor)